MDNIKTNLYVGKAMPQKQAKLPIIALTANVIGEARALFDRAGMNDFLSKPIEAEKLNIIMEKWVPGEKRVH